MIYDNQMISCVGNMLAKTSIKLAGRIAALIEARRRRIAHDREFYRRLDAYCRANDLPSACEDDWRSLHRK